MAKKTLTSFAVAAQVLELDLDTTPYTTGPNKFAQIPTWAKGGMQKPTTRRGLENSENSKQVKKLNPFKNLTIYPSVDPSRPQERALWRVLMKNCWPIIKANQILQQLTIQRSTRTILPRMNQEINEDDLERWADKKINVPLLGEEMTPNEIKKWMDEYAATLDLDSLVFDAFLFEREQGRTAIGMFPETRNKNGQYVLPIALRLIRPDLLRRPRINFENGELAGVEVTGLSSNGSLLDANRCIYFNNSKNNELFGDFYGVSAIQAIDDLGQALLIIYARDFINAANRTWRTPNIFQHELPTSQYSKAKEILEQFNQDLANVGNADISVPHTVTVVNGETNSGDISALLDIEKACIKGIAGYNHIPLFQISEGETGNLGGNANREENESLLTDEVKPTQERYEKTLENQFYDRILAILFMVEPEDITQVPVKIIHNYEKPVLSRQIPPDEWNIMMFLVDNGFTTMELVMEKYGLREMMKDDSPTQGTDTSPTRKTWEGQNHPTWGNRGNSWHKPSIWGNDRSELVKNWHEHGNDWIQKVSESKVDVLKAAKEHMKIQTKIAKKKLSRQY